MPTTPDYPPFMNAYGSLSPILEKIKSAKTPERLTYDFLGTTLGFKSSSARAFIPLAKRLGLLNSDGTPTDLYKAFRNTNQSQAAMATAIKKGFSQFYERNESAHTLSKTAIDGLIVEITGLQKSSPTVRAILGTFESLKTFADFSKVAGVASEEKEKAGPEEGEGGGEDKREVGLNLSYTINLVLPKSDDVAVFNAIFKSLRDNLLKK